MRVTSVLCSATRTPLIRFVGKRSVPKSIDHSPRVHPASPTGTLPDSFATYRVKAQQHGPLGRSHSSSSIGGRPGAALGPVKPQEGEFFDRAELPARFGRLPWTQAEIDAIETGGASLFA
ncbi:Ribosomal protein S36 mitochondrial [Penicillium bovifimosum]|uniref:Ribosomal protein S36 mitochondrial n=1 Tax=Penicillium bovifimosum TaxID=126998 RepID=A0A9W9GU68_9EURO|nr:Ribosomal protein S36 mitochondrial [Penicillium bovifimosum]KAJ5130107.1 Ribosomal protein S36 mitochondrial [Penicillium bovifimosum]